MKLYTAILKQIDSFHSQQKDFSIYDITREIRQAVNSGSLSLSDISVQIINNNPTYYIDHNDVRAIILELGANNLIKGYGLDFCITYGYSFYKFVGSKLSCVPTPVKTSTTGSATKSSIYTAIVNNLGPITSAIIPNGSKISQGNADKIYSYILARKGRNLPISLKNIQSRLKIKGLTVCDLKSELEKHGYALSEASCVSKSIIIS